jgi:Cu/Ag efflux protein CusF
MKLSSMRIIAALALTVALMTVLPGASSAAGHDHGSPGGRHTAAPSGAKAAPVYAATGVVAALDAAGGNITITHDPVPALGWPLMTMRFSLKGADLPEGLKAGDAVRFDFRNEGNVSVIVDIEVQ